jgi:hypothetical protein
MAGVAMRTDCRHYQSRTYGSGEAVRKCVLDLAPEAPWRCPAECPSYERKMLDAGWQYGSLTPERAPAEPHAEPAVAPADADAVAALLDEAENIVNDAGFRMRVEEEQRARRKMFRKKRKR